LGVCERGTEAPTLGPNVQATADAFLEEQASSFAFVTRGFRHLRNGAVSGLGKKENPEHRLLLLD